MRSLDLKCLVVAITLLTILSGKFVSNQLLLLLSTYYDLKALELVKKKEPCIEFTQENSIESSVQDCLSYIPQTTSLCTTLAYPK